MAKPYLSQKKLLETAEKVVAKSPNRVYKINSSGACEYVRRNAPSCVVGQILAELGVPLTTLKSWDDNGFVGIGKVLHDGNFPFRVSDRSGVFLLSLQRYQDTGAHTFGAALNKFKHMLLTDS